MTLQLCASPCAHAAEYLSSVEPTCHPQDDGDWDELDSGTLETWILEDFDWEIEESFPERRDYWDDSLDGEWDVAVGAMSNDVTKRE